MALMLLAGRASIGSPATWLNVNNAIGPLVAAEQFDPPTVVS